MHYVFVLPLFSFKSVPDLLQSHFCPLLLQKSPSSYCQIKRSRFCPSWHLCCIWANWSFLFDSVNDIGICDSKDVCLSTCLIMLSKVPKKKPLQSPSSMFFAALFFFYTLSIHQTEWLSRQTVCTPSSSSPFQNFLECSSNFHISICFSSTSWMLHQPITILYLEHWISHISPWAFLSFTTDNVSIYPSSFKDLSQGAIPTLAGTSDSVM